jgi:DNA-binding transcriptional LysR family regulator
MACQPWLVSVALVQSSRLNNRSTPAFAGAGRWPSCAAAAGRRGRAVRTRRCLIDGVEIGWWPTIIVRAPSHPLVGKKMMISMTTLTREPFVVREKGSDTWNSMEEGFGGGLGDINIAMEIRSTETIKQAAIAGMGISFLSAHTINQER